MTLSYNSNELEPNGFFLEEMDYAIYLIKCNDSVLTKKHLIDLFTVYKKQKTFGKVGLLFDLNGLKIISREAIVEGKHLTKEHILGLALLAESELANMLANYLSFVLKPEYPFQIFTDYESAQQWLKELKVNQLDPTEQIDSIYQAVLGIAQNKTNSKALTLNGNTQLDAIAAGVNMLSEYLEVQKEEHQQLKEQVEDFRFIFKESKDLCFISNTAGCFEASNTSFEKAFGYLPNELLGKRCFDYIHVDDFESTSYELERLKKGNHSVNIKNRIRKKDGTYVTCEWKVFSNRSNGKMYAVSHASGTNFHNKTLSTYTWDSLDYKRALLESNIVSITDRTGIVTFVNEAFCEISKFSSHELIGKEHIELNSKQLSKEFIRNIWITISYGKVWKGEIVNKNKAGELYYVDAVIVPFFDKHHVPVQYIIVSRDKAKPKIVVESPFQAFDSPAKNPYLHSTETLLINSLNDLSQGVQIIGFDWKYLYVNDAFAHQMKTTKEDLMHNSLVEKLPGIEFTKTFQSYISCFEFRKTEILEDRFFFPDGSTRNLKLRIEPIDSGIFVVSELAHEIYNTGQNSPLIEFAEDGILNSLPYEVSLVNEFGVIIAANDQWKNYFFKHGYHALQRLAIGANILDKYYEESIVGNEYAHKAYIGVKLVIEKKEASFKLVYPSYEYGFEKWFQLEVNSFESERPMAIISHTDISEIMYEKLKLGQNELKYRQICENSPVAMVNMDIETGMVLDINLMGLKLMRAKSKQEFVTSFNPFIEIIQDLKPTETLNAHSNGKESKWIETEVKKMDGTVFSAGIIKWQNPVSSMLQFAIIDLKDTGFNKKELMDRIDDLILKNKNLEQFNYIVSHNFKSHVSNIIGFTNILREEGDSKNLLGQAQEMLSFSANKLDEALVDLSKILYTGEQANEKNELIVLSDLISEIEESIRPLMLESGAEIQTNFSKVNEVVSVKAFITSIFYNLIVNGIKHCESGVKPIINIESDLVEDKVIFKVKDNGIGFNLMRDGENVFKPYKRFRTTTEGKGLGLFMVKTQIELLGGTVHLNSEPGNGSEFIIELNELNKDKIYNQI